MHERFASRRMTAECSGPAGGLPASNWHICHQMSTCLQQRRRHHHHHRHRAAAAAIIAAHAAEGLIPKCIGRAGADEPLGPLSLPADAERHLMLLPASLPASRASFGRPDGAPRLSGADQTRRRGPAGDWRRAGR
jgi:hypothetical protein